MAIVVNNTNYNGEVLERILTVATTGNELVDKGLIMVIPGVEKKISVPRLKAGKMLQKRKEDPQKSDAQGDFNYSEQTLEPHDFMAFTVFNPRAFEQIWRKWQPKGNLVFAELPPEAQNALLEALSKQVQFELGNLFVNGEYVSGGTDDQLMDGILTQAAKASDVIVVNPEGPTSMIDRLYAVRNAMRQYLLCHTGYDVRVAQNDGCLALLVPYSTTIYSSSYIDVDGKRFTLVFDAKSGRTTACGSVRTYRLPGERNAGGLIDPVFRQAPRVTESMVSVKLTDKKTSVACNVNANLAKLLYDYPQIPLIEYSRSSLQPSFRKELTSQLRQTTAGMTPEAAVGTLLNLVQHAFKYATDQEQFGFEKPLFPEESAIYGINDCEDRALLFSMLIRQVTGLDCLLVEYPGHVACAVRLPEYQGNGTCYSFEGHRYVLADPTFVGAKIGMCMPAYRGSHPKLSKLD